ncbi:uncharacterized protein LOC133193369 [Saccostrea echinata]|uniref:uncharacterized protein LOC133193369 n=1 Tax=Saccostrea echinata TaxID=191078 RepID=UPI002A82880D|nr:uncharacterized protein LOC133193369 [Saccostrea echinata]
MGLFLSLVSLSVYIQGSAAGCTSGEILTCSLQYHSAYRAAAFNHRKVCSAAYQLLDCMDNVLSACGSDLLSRTVANQAKQYNNQARQALAQYGCGNSADSLPFNLAIMAFGLGFYILFSNLVN